MNIHILSALADSSEFTGFEHTRIVDLLTVLAFVSLGMWAIVCLSFAIRQGAILVIRLRRYMRNHPVSLLKYLGMGRNNGS